jgi:hypothetical protein
LGDPSALRCVASFFHLISLLDFFLKITFALLPGFDRAMQLKDELYMQTGFHLYGVNEYIFAKAWHRAYTFTWEPYLDVPCLRVYDENDWFYADIFCYSVVAEPDLAMLQKEAKGGHLRLPSNYNLNQFQSNAVAYKDSATMPCKFSSFLFYCICFCFPFLFALRMRFTFLLSLSL